MQSYNLEWYNSIHLDLLMITPSSYNYSPQTLSPLTPSYNYSYVQSLSNVSISSHPSIMPFGSNSLTVSAPISANCNSFPMMSMGHTNTIPFQQANNYNGCGVHYGGNTVKIFDVVNNKKYDIQIAESGCESEVLRLRC
eukprot:748732_1